jgi:hypothetical protein
MWLCPRFCGSPPWCLLSSPASPSCSRAVIRAGSSTSTSRSCALDLAGFGLRLQRLRHRPLPVVHPQGKRRLSGHLHRRLPGAPVPRGLELVTWWPLALPHSLVVAVFAAGWAFGGARGWRSASAGGLISLLAVIGRIIRLVGRRYPRDLFYSRDGPQQVVLSGARLRHAHTRRISAVPPRWRWHGPGLGSPSDPGADAAAPAFVPVR